MLALALMALIKGGDMSKVAHVEFSFLVARVVYVPACVSGIPMLGVLSVANECCQPTNDGAVIDSDAAEQLE